MIEIPGFDNAWQLVHECFMHPAEKTSIAMHVFLKEWEDAFGTSRLVRDNLNTILVEYSRQEKGGGGYSVDGSYIRRATYSGLTITKGTVWVKIKDERLCDSSLVHELAHASIWALKGTDGDPDHLGGKYHGWTVKVSMVIQTANEKLCRLGI